MGENNLKVWDAVKTPPASALKKIDGGRLKGMTDISPQWRYKVMTEQFGMCGWGWKYEIARTWCEPGSDNQVMVFAEVALFTENDSGTGQPQWSAPIQGIGGSMLIAEEYSKKKEKYVLYSSDEAFKMAVTDALSVAMKMLGVGADIYMGLNDGSKHADKSPSHPAPTVSEVHEGPQPLDGADSIATNKEREPAMRKRILDICMTVAGGDTEQAGGVLAELTEWVDADTGKVNREGIRKGGKLNDIKGKALGVVYGKAKSYEEDWKMTHGTDAPEQADLSELPDKVF